MSRLVVLALLPFALAACESDIPAEGAEPTVDLDERPAETDEAYDDLTVYNDDDPGRVRFWTQYDRDDDGALDQTEFANGLVTGAWWDRVAGGGSILSEDGFAAAYGDQPWYSDDLYGAWNTDGYDGLTMSEFGLGVFGMWDEDGDGFLGEGEIDAGFFA